MFFPEDFKLLSIELNKKIAYFSHCKEAVVRTSISRTYYYIFLELRETLLVNFTKETKEKFISRHNWHHCLVPEILFHIGKETNKSDFIKASKNLKGIRKLRNIADYDTMEGFSQIHFENMLLDLPVIEKVNTEIKTIGRDILTNAFELAEESCCKLE